MMVFGERRLVIELPKLKIYDRAVFKLVVTIHCESLAAMPGQSSFLSQSGRRRIYRGT